MRISEAAPQQILQLISQIKKGELNVGDILTGRVITDDNGLLMLRLNDGSKISAQTVTDAQYSIGDLLSLEIIEEKQGMIFVRQTERNIMPDVLQNDAKANARIVLKSLGLPIDGNHMELLEAIKETGIEPSADIINNALRLLSEGQVSDPKQAVFLVCNNMADKEAYFPVLRNLVDGVFNFQNEWQNTTHSINLLDEKTVIRIAEGFLVNDALLGTDITEAITQIATLYSAEQSGANASVTSTLTMADVFYKDILVEGVLSLVEKTNIQSFQSEKTVSEVLPNISEGVKFQGIFNTLDFLITSKDKTAFDSLTNQFLPQNIIPDISQRNEIVKLLKVLLLQVKEKLPGTRLTVEEAKTIINSSVSRLLEKVSVKSTEAKLPKLDEWAKDSERRLNIIKEVLVNSAGPDKEKIQMQVRELETALRFFQDIISYEAYAQVPLILKDRSTNGEIYIMKRKNKSGKLNPDDFSVFLSLTTSNLGTIDTFINVRNKSVMLRFMAENEKYFGILQDEYKPLYEALKEKGFNLYEIKCSLREDEIHLINANNKASDFVFSQNKKIDMRI